MDKRAPLTVFDIDGVFVPFATGCFKPAAEEILGRELVQLNESYSFKERFGITHEEESLVWGSVHLLDKMRTVKPHAPALRLMDATANYCFMTSRGAHQDYEGWENNRSSTLIWLRHTLRVWDSELYFVLPEDKADKCLELGAVVLWDDHPVTALEAAEKGLTVFMPSYEYNEHVEHDRVFAVKGWGCQ